jgi:two-component system, OmpR family, sensor kinase
VTPADNLTRLRRQLTVLYTTTLAVGLIALATAVIVIDGRLRDRRADELLLGLAARSTSLVDESSTPPDVSGIDDDLVDKRADWLAVFATDGDIEVIGGDDLITPDEFVARALEDNEEVGTFGFVETSSGTQVRAAALPFFIGDDVAGAVIVASNGRPDPDQQRLVQIIVPGTALLIALGAIVGWLLAGRSIRPARAAVEHQERFLTAAAHELRTPVSRVRAVADTAHLIASDLPPTATSIELIEELARLRMLTAETGTVVEDLLTVARLDAGRLDVRHEQVALHSIVAAATASRPQVRSTVDDTWVINGDAVLLRRVLENLLINSERHGRPSDGSPAAISITAERIAGTVRLWVRDNGPGIPAALLPEVFDRFRSADPGGSGVGLWLSQWIAEAHGGSLTATNDGGAVFCLELPTVATTT